MACLHWLILSCHSDAPVIWWTSIAYIYSSPSLLWVLGTSSGGFLCVTIAVNEWLLWGWINWRQCIWLYWYSGLFMPNTMLWYFVSLCRPGPTMWHSLKAELVYWGWSDYQLFTYRALGLGGQLLFPVKVVAIVKCGIAWTVCCIPFASGTLDYFVPSLLWSVY